MTPPEVNHPCRRHLLHTNQRHRKRTLPTIRACANTSTRAKGRLMQRRKSWLACSCEPANPIESKLKHATPGRQYLGLPSGASMSASLQVSAWTPSVTHLKTSEGRCVVPVFW